MFPASQGFKHKRCKQTLKKLKSSVPIQETFYLLKSIKWKNTEAVTPSRETMGSVSESKGI